MLRQVSRTEHKLITDTLHMTPRDQTSEPKRLLPIMVPETASVLGRR
jgi:hypothetical protein